MPAFDLVVADEAHRVAGVTTKGNTSERDHRVVLDAERLRAKRRLFATATPRVYTAATKTRLGEREDIEFASMDDPEHFGAVAHRLWFRRAVKLERLVDYRLSIVVVTDAEVAELVGERTMLDVQGRRLDAETLASLVALRRALPELGLRRAITFHHTIKRASDFAQELERLDMDAPPVDASHINGTMSMADRERVLGSLKEPERPTVVTNARCLTEGIDVPALGAVAFVDPRSSAVDIVQAVGRVMRTAPDKTLGHVIVPVFLSATDLEDPEAAIESTAFAPVLAVLRALRAHDPELVSDATRIATSLGQRDAVAGGHISEHIQFLGAEIDVGRFEEALETRFVEVSKDTFEVGLAHLRAYVERTGDAKVPARHITDDGYRLGKWVSHRRDDRRVGRLAGDRIAPLEALPGWTWDPNEDDWQEGLAHLRAHIEREGHARVLHEYVADDGFRLGKWVSHRRNDLRVGRLPDDRAATLETLPGWTWDPSEDDWQEGLAHLRDYIEREGHARVPGSHVAADGHRLGRWVKAKRTDRRGGRLTDDRVAEFEALPGWTWDLIDEVWQEGLSHLRAYVVREGQARVPGTYAAADGYRLGAWVSKKRIDRRLGKLPDDRIAALEEIPGWRWDTGEDDWQEGLAHLRTYVEREGHSRVPQKHVAADTYRLGMWVSARRNDRGMGKLPDDRVAALEAFPGWTWDPNADDWQASLIRLHAYIEQEGHARVPSTHTGADGFRLGLWVSTQRNARRKGRLPDYRATMLEAVPGWAWDPIEDDWQESLTHLRTYIKQEGHAQVPWDQVAEDGYRLGQWVANRRSARRRGKLPGDRVAALEAIPGWTWDVRRPADERADPDQ